MPQLVLWPGSSQPALPKRPYSSWGLKPGVILWDSEASWGAPYLLASDFCLGEKRGARNKDGGKMVWKLLSGRNGKKGKEKRGLVWETENCSELSIGGRWGQDLAPSAARSADQGGEAVKLEQKKHGQLNRGTCEAWRPPGPGPPHTQTPRAVTESRDNKPPLRVGRLPCPFRLRVIPQGREGARGGDPGTGRGGFRHFRFLPFRWEGQSRWGKSPSLGSASAWLLAL